MNTSQKFRGDNRLLLGIILGVITFWLFAQSLVNLVVPLQSSYNSDIGTINIAVSLSALFSGLFIVGAGDIADKIGRVKVTYIGLALNIVRIIETIKIERHPRLVAIKHTPETKAEPIGDQPTETKKFDVVGLIILVVSMLSINVIITQTSQFGLFSPFILGLIAIFVISLIIFVIYENKIKQPLVDFDIFKNKGYTGATISNFMLNGVAGGTLIVVNTFYQQKLDFNSQETGYISLTYLIAVLIMIRVGEMILQSLGPKRPLLLGSALTVIGLILLSLTFLPNAWYIASSVIGYLLFGTGLGVYATPSTDTAVAQAPDDKVGVASGVYKMASSLGNAFGVAISSTVYSVLAAQLNLTLGGFTGVMFNAPEPAIAIFIYSISLQFYIVFKILLYYIPVNIIRLICKNFLLIKNKYYLSNVHCSFDILLPICTVKRIISGYLCID